MGVQAAGVIIAMPAMPPAIPSCGMRVISNADMPMPAPASRYAHDRAITAVGAGMAARRSRLTAVLPQVWRRRAPSSLVTRSHSPNSVYGLSASRRNRPLSAVTRQAMP